MKVIESKNLKWLILYVMTLAIVVAVVDSGITAHFRGWLRMQIPNLDKVGHFFGMGFLTYLSLIAFIKIFDKKIVSKTIIVVFLMVTLATVEEYSQRFLEYRSFQLWDLAANYFGIIFFCVVFLLHKIQKYQKLSSEKSPGVSSHNFNF